MINSSYKSTFTIIARDPKTGNIAIGGGSHWFAYATIVPFIEAGVGAIATQAESNISYGPRGIQLLKKGMNPEDVIKELTKDDEGKELRQVIVMDKDGNASAFTGSKTIKFAAHFISKDFAVAGNTLDNEKIIDGMKEFYTANDKLPFGERIIKTLQKAQELGGDIRGKQSSGLLIAKPKNTGEFWNDLEFNLRIDDNSDPFSELERQYKVAAAYKEMNAGDNAYFEKNDKKAASEHYETAFKLFPENPEIKFWYAKLLNDMGNADESKKFLNELTTLDKRWEEFWKRIN